MSAQAEAMQRVAEIMGEHFTAFVVIGLEDIDDSGESIRMEIGGGTHCALGLLARVNHDLLNHGHFETRGEEQD